MERHIHSEEHLLAADISKHCGEPKRFNLYLGTVLKIGKQRASNLFRDEAK
jgi:hypothetical protein